MKAMILAAGLGTRLMPLTADKPKALVEVGGKTLLEHCINNLISQGFDHIVVNVHHFAPMIYHFLSQHSFNASIYISDESDRLLDTGGGIIHARPFLDGDEPFLVHNVDIISDINLQALLRAHTINNALATLAVSSRESSRVFLFDSDMRLSGWRNMLTGKSIIPNEQSVTLNAHAFAGIHVLSPLFFQLTTAQGAFSIVDQYLNLCVDNRIYGVKFDNNYIIDVGKPNSLKRVEEYFLNRYI
ncbi:MAG: nucleotidyltransferase family protein [Bacteroidales bacterium]|nr:nucleotidyltransferase family protein [Bacteroidales bacterium]